MHGKTHKAKPCKASSKAKVSDIQGCGESVLERTYGLGHSCGCYAKWLLNSPEGKEKLQKATLSAPKKRQEQTLKQSRKKTKERKEALMRKQDWEKRLEKVFNEFIRLRDKEQPCISCDAPAGTYTMTAGHYYPAGSYKNIRFDEDNVHGQCWYNCNKNKHGNLSEYQPRLVARIGQERFDELVERRNVPAHFTIPEIKEMIAVYKEKVKELKKQQNA